MVYNVFVKSLAAYSLQNCSKGVVAKVAILVERTRLVIVIGILPGLGRIRVDYVKREITCSVIKAGRVREQHLYSNGILREIWIDNREPDIFGDRIVKINLTLLHHLHNCCSGKRFGDGGNSEDIAISKRGLSIKVFVAQRFVVDNLAILYGNHRKAHSLVALHNLLKLFLYLTIFAVAALKCYCAYNQGNG